MKPLNAEGLNTLRWLLEQRRRRNSGHPETIHTVTVELPTDNLWLENLGAMASLHDVTPDTLLRRYLIRGLEADLDEALATHGRHIGHTPPKK